MLTQITFKIGDELIVRLVDPLTKKPTIARNGICLSIRRSKYETTFVLRNIIEGVGVEWTFSSKSPLIDSVEIINSGPRITKSKLYRLRNLNMKHIRLPKKG